MFDDHYEALGVEHSASADEIKRAYRELARMYHPDVHPSAIANVLLSRINEAYAVLSDPEARARYDRGDRGPRARRPPGPSPSRSASPPPPRDPPPRDPPPRDPPPRDPPPRDPPPRDPPPHRGPSGRPGADRLSREGRARRDYARRMARDADRVSEAARRENAAALRDILGADE